jgi:cytochrome c553
MNVRLFSGPAILATVAGLAIGLMALQARTQGSAEAGAGKAAVCVACHGMNGNSTNPEWPSLAGQEAHYTARQLELFRSGKRVDPLMSPMSTALSDEDIADLAAYYAAQTPAGLEADPSHWAAGQALYRGGDMSRDIPACIACHGPAGRGIGSAGYPAVRAQHAAYAQKQLRDYASGARTGDHAHIMRTIAGRLSPEEVLNLSSYMQGMR